jgi:hypothetical protein
VSENPFLARIERQGELKGVRETVLGLLEDRFGSVPEELQDRVRRITEMDCLRVLRRNAGRSASLQTFADTMDSVAAS